MSIFGRFRKPKDPATKQEGDVHALDREDDPRGGVQSAEYRRADPREVVEAEGVVMSAPGGAPQEGKSVEERRRENEDWRDGPDAEGPS